MADKVVMPIELQVHINNLKEIKANLESELQKVDAGSSIYRSIKTELAQVEKLLKNADLQVNVGITKQSELDRLLGNLQKSAAILDDVKGRFSSLDIKDLNLSNKAFQQPLQEIETLSRELERIQQQMSQMQNTNVATILKDAGESLAGFSKGDLAKGATQFLDEIEAKSAEATEKIEKLKIARDKLNDQSNIARGQVAAASPYYQDVLRLSNEAKSFNANGRLTNSGIAQAYQNFINNSWNASEQKWNDVDKVQSLLKLIGLDDETIQKVIQSGGQAIQMIQDYFQNHQKGLTAIFSTEAKKAAEAEKGQAFLDDSKKQIDDINKRIGTLEGNNAKRASQAESVKRGFQQKGYYNFENEINNIKNSISQLWTRIEQIGRQGANGPTPQAPSGAPETERLLTKEQAGEQLSAALANMSRRWIGTYAIINKVRQGIRQAWSDIQGLDKAMTNIAVVTSMSVDDLWGKINDYMSLAQQYGVTTQGVYEVSQLYYQQGLGTDEVMAATTETLKMARIAGMDYAAAANAMTVAIRSFKMEMTDASHVTDVYSKVAAVTASDSEELATAMSKTASSAESVGSSFENTTAMLAVMIETTRESAQNLGSALKSIISRYGEMKSGLTQDSEGEEIDYNKTDAALRSVGISLKDAQGQFRDFDEVIFELAEKWDTLDKNTQRYIATVMAGNRQQSRFIALVDNWERLEEVSGAANEDSEDAGLLQYSKTLDSLETKLNNIKTSFQQFYMGIADGPFFKGILDFVNGIIQGFSKMGTLFSTTTLANLILSIKSVITIIGALIKNLFSEMYANYKNFENQKTQAAAEGARTRAANEIAESNKANSQKLFSHKKYIKIRNQDSKITYRLTKGAIPVNPQQPTGISKRTSNLAYGAQIIGSGLSLYGASLSGQGKLTGGAALGMAGNALSMGASGFMMSGGNPIGAVIGALLGALSGLPALIKSLDKNVQLQQDYENKKKLSDEAEIKRAETKDKYNNLNEYLTKLENLEKTRYDSQENYDEWVKVNSQALEAFPELASTFDAANNAVVDLTAAENNLTQARINAQNAAKDAADAQIATALANQKIKEKEQKDLTNWAQNTFGEKTQVKDRQLQTITSPLSTTETWNYEQAKFFRENYGSYTASRTSLDEAARIGNKMFYLSSTNIPFAEAVKKHTNFSSSSPTNVFSTIMSLAGETDPFTFIEKLLNTSNEDLGLKDGVTIDDFINTLTYGKYKNWSDFAAAFPTIQRETQLSQKATENTVRAGIGTYLSSDFMWEDQDESFIGLANVNKVFQEALYKDFETFLNGGKITEESWEKWVNSNYNGVYADLQKYYENFYKILSSQGQIEDYNAFEQGSSALTVDEYKERLEKFGAEFKVEKGDPNLLGDELVNQFTEEYNKAEKEFKEALKNVEFLDEDYITNLLDDDSTFNFRQEYSDEIMTQARQLEKYVDAGKITSEQAITYFDNYINIWEEIDSTSNLLNSDDLEKARKLLANADLTTPEGIVQFYEQLAEIYEQAGVEIPKGLEFSQDSTVNSLISSSMINLNTSYQNLGKTVATKVDTMADQLDKAKKGFDNLADVSEMVDKYDLSYSDFSFDTSTGKWTATQKVYDKIREKEQADWEEERKAVDKAYEDQLSIINDNQNLIRKIGNKGSPLSYKEIKQEHFIGEDGTIEAKYIKINDILEQNWDNYVDWYNEVDESQRVSFIAWMGQRHSARMKGLSEAETDFLEYIDRETERQAKIDAKTAYDIPIENQRRQEAYSTFANNYSKLTKDQLNAIEVDLGWEDGTLKQYLKDNQNGTYSITRAFIASNLFSTLSPETQNAILSSMDAEFNAASEAMSNLGSVAAGKADPGVYAKAFDKTGLGYEDLEKNIPYWIRSAATGGPGETDLKAYLREQLGEDFGTEAEIETEVSRQYQEIMNNFFDTAKSNTLTTLDAMGKALDGTLGEQEKADLKDLDFGQYNSEYLEDFKNSGKTTLDKYWNAIASAIKDGLPKEQWESYFDDAAERSFKEAFSNEENNRERDKLNREISQASGKFSEDLITDVAKQAGKILDPNLLKDLFEYDAITDTYSAKINKDLTGEALEKAREDWIKRAVSLGFSGEALKKSFKGQDYDKIIKTDTIQESLNNLLTASSEITLDSIKSLYDEIYGEGAFTSDQDFDLINTWIDQAKEGSYNNIVSYIQSLYEAAAGAGYDIDTSEIKTLIQQFYESIIETLNSALSAGVEGTLDTATFNDLAKKYGISGTKIATGYSLGESAQRTLVTEMYKAAELSGSTTGFGEQLWGSWSESENSPFKSYKNIEETLREVNSEIEKMTDQTSEAAENARAYAAALEQAREAAYLDPNAYEFSFMEQDSTSSLTQNFDNFVSQIDTIKSVFESFDSGEAVGYEDFYNMMDFIGNSEIGFSKFSELTGIAKENYESFVNSVVKNTDEWGKVDIGSVAAELGISVDAAMTAMSESMTDGLKEVADQQINYLTGLENMLLAMQALNGLNAEAGIDFSINYDDGRTFKSFDEILNYYNSLSNENKKEFLINIKPEIEKLPGNAGIFGKLFAQDGLTGEELNFLSDIEEVWNAAAPELRKRISDLTQEQAMWLAEEFTDAEGNLDYVGLMRRLLNPEKLGESFGFSLQEAFAGMSSFDIDGTKIKINLDSLDGNDFILEGINNLTMDGRSKLIKQLDDILKTQGLEIDNIDYATGTVTVKKLDLVLQGQTDLGTITQVMDEQGQPIFKSSIPIGEGETLDLVYEGDSNFSIKDLKGLTKEELQKQIAEHFHVALESVQLTEIEGEVGQFNIDIDFSTQKDALTLIQEDLAAIREAFETGIELKVENDAALDAINAVKSAIDDLPDTHTIFITTIKKTIDNTRERPNNYVAQGLDGEGLLTGNMNNITGSALADGNVTDKLLAGANLANKTLVGELGPELAVYNGKYHMLGANGAEFVKLPSDAIVFNHLQTAGILKGQMNVRGQALAEGNVSGPALAGGGIDSALAAVRRAKAVWQGLLDNLTAAELTDAAGGGGGGGGVKNHSEELQEWYNLSRQISNIEQEINNILAERENITEGDSYLRSLREQQKLLREQANIQEVLLGYQQLQLKRQADIINNDRLWSRFLEVDESGLLQYTKGNELNGGKGALQVLQEMNEMSGEDQVKFLEDIGYTYTTVDGEELKQGELVQKFYEELQKQIDDYDALYDTVHETKETLEGIDTNISEIDEEIKQNQMDLEEAIFDIIVEAWEKQIEQMEEYNDLVKEANDKYIDGLNDALEKEKELYSQNETIAEREQLQRRLSLLRRSGGSASEIASLEEQLDDKLKDEYFKNQEDAIKNIQEANDRQVELLEQQVKLQQDSLEYQKEHGVIWSQVYDIMSGSAEEILAFMQGRKPDFFTQSLLQQEEMLTEWAMKIGIYTEDKQYQNHEAYARGSIWDNGNIFNNDKLKSLQGAFSNLTPEQQQQLQEYFSSVYATSRIGGADEATATQEAIDALKRKMGDYSEQQGLVSGGSGGKDSQSGDENKNKPKYETRYSFTDYTGKKHDGYKTKQEAEKAARSLASQQIPLNILSSTHGIEYINAVLSTIKPYQKKISGYSRGGIVDYTGLAMVHGSKSKPESFLNAEQTAQIREALEISGNRNMLEDVRSSLQALQSTIKSITNIANNSETSSITIAPGAVVIEVAELADSYDVDTLSADVMNRIVNIANKRTTRSVNRR